MNNTLYEVVKTVKGYDITRMKGTRGFYTVYLSKRCEVTFRTIKAAVQYIEQNLGEKANG